MRWLPNISCTSFPSPSSPSLSDSSSTPSPEEKQRQGKDRVSLSQNDRRNQRNSNRGFRNFAPRISRQRKSRHLSEKDLVAGKSVEEAEEPSVLSRSTSSRERDNASNSYFPIPKSAPLLISVPLPLPLPVPDADGEQQRHPSPKKDGDKPDLEPAGSPSTPVARASAFAARDSKKAKEFGDSRLSPRMACKDVKRERYSGPIYSVNVPSRSGTNSPFASPQRRSDTDGFPGSYVFPQGNEVRPAPEMQMLDIPGLSPPAFFDYSAFSTDNTPLHSPQNRSPHRDTRSPNAPASPMHPMMSSGPPSPLHPMMSSGPGSPLHPMLSNGPTSPLHPMMSSRPASPFHPKLSIEIPSTRHDGGPISGHRLPLPPGAALPSPSSISPVASRQEPFPMNNQWQKGKLIGRGTFGSVYVASNRETGALCAMKEVEIFPDDPKSAECIKQLEQEIKILSQLKHPNIVQYYGSEIVEDKFYIYLEYVHPGSINKYVREHCGAMTESVVRNFTRHILSGLAYLHSTKTIHRDIKGANLLVDALGVVKLADFGMSKHLSGQRADLSLKGSPYWMAPELMQAVLQKDNRSDLALAVDIWSLGCTIIEMFTGKPPWSEFEGAAALFKVMRDTPPVPETLSPEGKDFLRCCFQRNPAQRPTASMLLEHRFVQSSTQSALPSPTRMKSVDLPLSPK